MNDEDRTPVLIGAGQYTQRDVELSEAKSPLDLMLACARRAAEDAGIRPGDLAQLDSVAVVNVLSWPYANAPGLLAELLGARPKEELYTTVGGNTPQWLVNETVEKIATGRARFALLAGAETVNTIRRAQRARVSLPWGSGGQGAPTVVGDPRPGTNEIESAHGLQLPAQIYPLFENALRAHAGRTIAEHREQLGTLYARLSAVAAENPYAWFRRPRSADEITRVTTENRMIAFPYTKFMNAIMDVDQSAAVLMTSVSFARELGVAPSRCVYLWGSGDASDHWFVTERVSYQESPAIRIAGARALETAGLGIHEIDHFDLYSCFPCAVRIAARMLGLKEDDPRPPTVTGGLAYHGGPGNNYSMHAIATMMHKLRARPGSTGLVTALGWYLTKHSIGVYGTEPRPWRRSDPAVDQAGVDRMPAPPLARAPQGRGVIETYTVVHDRDGDPVRGFVIGRLEDGQRFLAHAPQDRAVLESMMEREAIGLPGTVSSSGGENRFEL